MNKNGKSQQSQDQQQSAIKSFEELQADLILSISTNPTQEHAEILFQQIRNMEYLPVKQRPRLPIFPKSSPTKVRLYQIQHFINEFEYNHTTTNYFHPRKDRGLLSVTLCVKDIIREALPIKCIEAVFIAFFMTSGMDVDRFPLSFKSTVDGHIFRHIVLAVKHQNKWGALGLSRRHDLMFKELQFESLSSLVLDFIQAYKRIWHSVSTVYIGLPFGHNPFSQEKVLWKVLRLKCTSEDMSDICLAIDRYVKIAPQLYSEFVTTGQLSEEFAISIVQTDAEPTQESSTLMRSTIAQKAKISIRPSTNLPRDQPRKTNRLSAKAKSASHFREPHARPPLDKKPSRSRASKKSDKMVKRIDSLQSNPIVPSTIEKDSLETVVNDKALEFVTESILENTILGENKTFLAV